MTPLEHLMTPGTEALAQAARQLAGIDDADVLESIVRKVERSARRAVLVRFTADASNDTEDG